MGQVAVAGGSGSLGTMLVQQLLADGEEVTVLLEPGTRPNRLISESQARLVVADIRDENALFRAVDGARCAYNVAGVSALDNRRHADMFAVNVQGARIFAQVCARAGVERLVHVSSISAVGYPQPGQIADETFPVTDSQLTNSYALTKNLAEQAVTQVAETTGLEVCFVCPSAVVAPWSDLRDGWAAVVKMASQGRLRAAPPGRVSLCSQEAFLSGTVGAMRRGIPGQRYILASEDLTYLEFFTLINQVVARPPVRVVVPGAVLAAVAGAVRALTFDRYTSPLVAKENVDLMRARLRYDPSRAERELGMNRGDVRESIRNVYRWLIEEDL